MAVGVGAEEVALGRRAVTTGLDLDAAGVEVDESGAIAVDGALRTSNPRIRAAGDVTPLPRFTHTAGVFGSTATQVDENGMVRRSAVSLTDQMVYMQLAQRGYQANVRSFESAKEAYESILSIGK